MANTPTLICFMKTESGPNIVFKGVAIKGGSATSDMTKRERHFIGFYNLQICKLKYVFACCLRLPIVPALAVCFNAFILHRRQNVKDHSVLIVVPKYLILQTTTRSICPNIE